MMNGGKGSVYDLLMMFPIAEGAAFYIVRGMSTARCRAILDTKWGRRAGTGILMAGFVLVGNGCGKSGGPPPPQMATVTVMHPRDEGVTDWEDFPGRLQSPQSTSIQARVSGLITETPFKEGALVHTGDVLFVIDDRPFKADLDNKKATVAKDAAQVDLTNAQLARSQRLLNTHVVDQQDFDIAEANYRQAQAQLAADQAAQESSELNMEWTRVRAPINGLVSKINVTVGNLITGGVGNGTALTTLVSVDPLYCYVPVPERTYLKYEEYARKEGKTVRESQIGCSVELENETDFPHKGVIDFVDNSVDPDTGTIQMRGVFQNPDNFLTAGLFARMRIEGGGKYKALLVPDEAVGTDQNERFLLVVDPSNTVVSKRVQLGRLVGDMRVIDDGITAEDRVIVNGLQMARPGAKVNVEEAPATTATGAATTGTAGAMAEPGSTVLLKGTGS
jgi:membrane fusion protein, multidrug efflux system